MIEVKIKNEINTRILIATSLSGVYFIAIFFLSLQKSGIPVWVGVMTEMVTIPMILLQLAIPCYIIYTWCIKKAKPKLAPGFSLAVSLMVIAAMFIVE